MPHRLDSRSFVGLAAAVLLAVVAAGCIGATDRADFDAEVRARGGGLTNEWVADALDLIAAEVDVSTADELAVLGITINTASRSVVAEARRGDRPDFVDRVSVIEGDVRSTMPVQDADQLDLDAEAIAVGELPLERLEELGDTAITELDEADAAVKSIVINRIGGDIRITISLESARRTGSATFDVNGELIEGPR